MIINLSNFGGGGGGSQYVLSAATSDTLGGIMVGSGLSITSAGTLSVEGGDAEYALALKSLGENGEQFRVVNEGGWIYYIDDYRNDEEDAFVRVMYNTGDVVIKIDLNGQAAASGEDRPIIDISSDDIYFRMFVDENGKLFFFDDADAQVYYDPNEEQYTKDDFTFNWTDSGNTIRFSQNAVNNIEVNPQTDNYEVWYLLAQESVMANDGQLGLVKIGEGINLAEDGTISVEGGGGGIEVVTSLPSSGTDGQLVNLIEKQDAIAYVQVGGNKKAVGYYENAETAYTIVHASGSVLNDTAMFYAHFYDAKCYFYLLADGNYGYKVYNGSTLVTDLTPMTADTMSFTFVNNSGTMTKDGDNLVITVLNGSFYEVLEDLEEPFEKQTLYKYSETPVPAIEYHLSNDRKMFNMNWSDIKNVMSDGDVLFYVYNLNNMDVRYSNGTLYSTNRSDWGIKTPSSAVSEFVGVYIVWDNDNLQFWFAQNRSVSGGTLFSGKAQMSGWTRVGVVQEDACEGYANSNRLGMVKVDGNGLSMDNGLLKCTVSAPTATTTTAGVVKPSSGLTVSNDGTLTTQVQSSNVGNNVVKIWLGTQDEYDAIQTYDQYTVYIIKEATV